MTDGQSASRGVRGATLAASNDADAIREAIEELLTELVGANEISSSDVTAAFFTTTPDLNAAFPAETARHMGWQDVPMLGAVEMSKPGALGRCIRVLLLWNTNKRQDEIQHRYLRGTDILRMN